MVPIGDMVITIPKILQKRVKERAKRLAMTEEEYIQNVLEEAVEAEDALDDEMRMWMEKSRKSTLAFWEKHTL